MKDVKKWERDRFVPGSIVGVKIDGLCGRAKEGKILSTTGSAFTGLQHIEEKLNPWDELMGELYIPGMEFNKASGIIRSHRKHKPEVRYALFDNLMLSQLEYQLRFNDLTSNYPPLDVEEPISFIPHMVVQSLSVLDTLYQDVLDAGFEGLVIKAPDGRWMKRKKTYKGHHVVLEVFEGKGKYLGMLGGVVIDMGNGITTRCAGFNDQQRSDFWEDPSLILEHTILVHAMEHTKTGRLRHANFKEIVT